MKAPKGKAVKERETEIEPSSWDRLKDAIHKIALPKKAKQKSGEKTAK